ncbi:DUF7453 family protein, partial [Iningainema tapete]
MNTYIHNIRSQRRLINFAVENSHQNAKLGEKWKKWLQNWSGGVTLSLCLSALAATQVQAATYSFTKIADTKSFPWRSISRNVVINDSGTVSFLVTSTRQSQYISGYRILYTSNGNQLTEIANSDTVSSLFGLGVSPAQVFLDSVEGINNNGTIAFRSQYAVGYLLHRALLTSQNGSTIRRADYIFQNNTPVTGSPGCNCGLFLQDVSEPRLNDLEEVVYLKQPYGISLSKPNQSNLSITTISSSSVDINNNSEVVFGTTKAIYTNGSVSPLVEIRADALDINDSGDVVLSNQNTISLFHRASGSLSTIADISGQFRGFGNPVINNSGKVAFGAILAFGESAIYTGADPVNDKVIASGDTLFGSTVKNVYFSSQGLNNQGQIVFLAEFTDGTQGMFLAEPVSDSSVVQPQDPPLEEAFTISKIVDITPLSDGVGNFTSIGSSAIDGNTLVFNTAEGIYKISDGVLSIIADKNTAIPG